LITVRIFQGFILFDEGPVEFFNNSRQPTALALVVSFISMLVNDAIMVGIRIYTALGPHEDQRFFNSGLFGVTPDSLEYYPQ
jgi:hypothetical protein